MNIKRTVFLAVLGLACVFAAIGQTPVELDAAIQQASKDIDRKITGGPKVALLNVSSPTNDLSAYVLREMALVLEKNKRLTMMARQNIDNALRQANLTITSEITDAAAKELGKKVGADHAVVGFFEKMPDDSYRFRTRLVNPFFGDIQPVSSFTIKETPQLRKLLNIADPAPAVVTPAQPAPPPAPAPAVVTPAQPTPPPPPAPVQVDALKNGTYTLMPRPQARLNGVWQRVYISKVEVDSEYITFYFENDPTTGDGRGRSSASDWDRNNATLTNIDKPSIYQKSSGYTGTGGLTSGDIVSCVFRRIDGKNFKMENRQGMIIAEIKLGEPD